MASRKSNGRINGNGRGFDRRQVVMQAEQVTSAAAEIARIADEVSAGAETQVRSLDRTFSGLNEMTASLKETGGQADSVAMSVSGSVSAPAAGSAVACSAVGSSPTCSADASSVGPSGAGASVIGASATGASATGASATGAPTGSPRASPGTPFWPAAWAPSSPWTSAPTSVLDSADAPEVPASASNEAGVDKVSWRSSSTPTGPVSVCVA